MGVLQTIEYDAEVIGEDIVDGVETMFADIASGNILKLFGDAASSLKQVESAATQLATDAAAAVPVNFKAFIDKTGVIWIQITLPVIGVVSGPLANLDIAGFVAAQAAGTISLTPS